MKQLNKTSRSYTSIFLENIFTVFNGLLAVCFCLVILAGSPQDALFVIVVFINMLIGIVVEVKAKWDLDKLSILIANKVKILKKEKFQNLSESNFQKILQDKTNSQIEEDIEEAEIDQVRAGDVVYISSGDQIVIDGKVLKSNGLEVDQSILTGESDTVKKQTNDEVLSGSVAVSGSAICLVRAVGADSYIEKIAVEAKKYKLIKSDLVDGVNKILKYISFGILPIALLLLYSQAREYGSINDIFINGQWKEAVVQATAGIVGMIPEGLVLLTSFNFALAVIILARQKVIIQQLPAVEGLARVDTLCLDKTGTITDGTIVAENIEILDKLDENSIKILSAIIEFTTKNNTSLAIEDYINKTFLLKDRKKHLDINESDIIEFSSKRKYSGLIVNNDRGFDGKWLLGAPEIVINPKFKKDNLFGNISDNLAKGKRVLALAKNGQPKLLIICSENIRSDAAKTIAYFYKQGINPIIISGDSSESVSQIAKGVNFKNIAEYNSQNLPNNMEEVREIVKKYNVFGRVLPDQKKILVQALQSAGKTVAMTGDGVNDVLALKQSDLSVVMANAAPAAKSIAHIVLTDSAFWHLPNVLGQGRRVMANMERVASLFLTKTFSSIFLSLATVIILEPYPLLPRHLTAISALTIGIPSFFLALPPNNTKYVKGFLKRIIRFSLPAGFILGLTIFTIFTATNYFFPKEIASSYSVIAALVVSFIILALRCRPLKSWRICLLAILIILAILVFIIPFTQNFFQLELF